MDWKVLVGLLASFFYSGEAVFTEKKAGHISPLFLTFVSGVMVAVYCVPGLLKGYYAGTLTLPQGKEWLWVLFLIPLLTFLGDLLHFDSLTGGGEALSLCIAYMTMAVFGLVWHGFLEKFEKPSPAECIAYFFFGAGIFILLFKGKLQ